MKSSISRIAVVFLVTFLSVNTLFADTKSKTVQFPEDMKVNGTLVRKGTYEVKFDDKSGELSIMKNKKVIARASATLAKRDRSARQFVLRSSGSGDDLQLTGVTFMGSDHDVIISGTQASK
jgi:hypothetical protein